MSRTLPAPPDGVRLSPVPNKTVDDAVVWLQAELEMSVTPRYIKRCIAEGKLRCHIVARRRMLSTQDLYAWIVTRPTNNTATA
ncbi:hypothetical protein [Mycobacterium sp. DL592]|uniref:hypothetical protein n=1 Tax=Mycobacterium sp. DL592 TaxID=2675524 RepID=UPI00142076F1|nr:hypothetical protein [Mycobacterium sp. DL592]